MITNINYRGKFLESTSQFKFKDGKPRQYVHKCDQGTIVVFQSGKCRIMGCKQELDFSRLPFKIENLGIQSLSLTINLFMKINLHKISLLMGQQCSYEPELFPALRYLKYNPLCVNVFASGKIVVLGIKTLDCNQLVENIIRDLFCYI